MNLLALKLVSWCVSSTRFGIPLDSRATDFTIQLPLLIALNPLTLVSVVQVQSEISVGSVEKCSFRLLRQPQCPQEFARHLQTALVAALAKRGHDRAVAGIAAEGVVDAAQYGLQFLAVLTILTCRVVRIISHAVHVFIPFALSFAKDTYLPHPRYSRPEGILS